MRFVLIIVGMSANDIPPAPAYFETEYACRAAVTTMRTDPAMKNLLGQRFSMFCLPRGKIDQ